MIPQLPSKREIDGQRIDVENDNKSFNNGIDSCLPRIKYLEGLVEELGEALVEKNIYPTACVLDEIDKYTAYKREK